MNIPCFLDVDLGYKSRLDSEETGWIFIFKAQIRAGLESSSLKLVSCLPVFKVGFAVK